MDHHKPSATSSPRFANHPFQFGDVASSWSSPADNVSATFSPRAPVNDSLHATERNAVVNDEVMPIIKRPRACEACRHLKVRCIPSPDSTDGACRRCVRGKRQCIVTAPTRRRPKRTDAKVVELEKQIEALKTSLEESRALNESLKGHEHHRSLPDRTHTHPAESNSFEDSSTQQGGTKRNAYGDVIADQASPPANHRTGSGQDQGNRRRANSIAVPRSSTTTGKNGDFIEKGIVDLDTAFTAFYHYVNNLAPHFPVVVFSAEQTFDDVRDTKPLLLLAIVSVSIGTSCPEKRTSLAQELTYHFADRIFIHAEKSLELVQALLVIGIWYFSYKSFDELTFYQLVHYAVILCCDLGLNRRTKPSSIRGVRPGLPGKPGSLPPPDAAETRRTWLGCYLLAIK